MVKVLERSLSRFAFVLLLASPLGALGQGSDLELMISARDAFKQNKLSEAIEIYSKIPVSSDFWLDSLEERAWAHTRNKNYEKALGDLKSVANKVWAPQAGPETMMLSAFVSFKICAYKDVLDKVGQFKTRMIPRVEALEKILNQPLSSKAKSLISRAAQGQLKMSQLGSDAEKYPRYFYRDQSLISAFQKQDERALSERMKALAERDLSEIEKNLKKMKVLEVEVIQRVFTQDRVAANKQKLNFENYDRNTQVSFPVSDDEVWVDEVGHYEVKAESCPQ